MIPDILLAVAAWTPGQITTLSVATVNVTVAGAAVGDFVVVSYDQTIVAGLILSAQVTAANTVTINIFNATAGSLTPVAGNIRLRVQLKNTSH